MEEQHKGQPKSDVLDFCIWVSVYVVVEADGDGFHAYCPVLKGLHTSGSTEAEAKKNARDAAEAYLGSLIKHGDPIPPGVGRAQ